MSTPDECCPRCNGALYASTDPGDRDCLACGNVVYATPPLPFVRERAGQSRYDRASAQGTRTPAQQARRRALEQERRARAARTE